MIVVLFLLQLPLLPLLISSFSQRWLFPALLPTKFGMRGWRYLFSTGTQLWNATAIGLLVSGIVMIISLLAAFPTGRALGLHRFRGKKLVNFIIMAPAIMPAFGAAMGIQVVFIRYGLADTLPGVVLVHLIPVLPYVVLVLSGVFANYNTEIEEEARTLGARPWQVLYHVTFPTVAPGLLVAAMFAFNISWGQYLLTLLIGGGRIVTLPILLINFVNSGDYSLASALSLVFILPVVVILWFISGFLGGQYSALGGFEK